MATTPRSIDRKQSAVVATLGPLAAGGLLLVVGSLLTFATADIAGFGSVGINGLDTDDGKLFLGVGVALLVIAAVVWISRSATSRRIFGGIATLAASFMVVAAIMDVTTLEDDIPEALAADISVSAGIGLYLVLAGAVIATLGGVQILFGRLPAREQVEAPPPPPPPSPPPTPPSPEEREEAAANAAADDMAPPVKDPWP